MHENWPDMAGELNPLVAGLRQAQPEVMKGFGQMAQAALKPDALDTRTKELIALAISVHMGAGPSVMYAAQALEAVSQWRARDE